MGKDWDYAKLTKSVAEAGGVDAFLDTLIKKGKDMGHIEAVPFLLLAAGVGAISLKSFQIIKDKVESKKQIKQEEIDAAKQEVKEAINSYLEENEINNKEDL